jgi:murein DD-endopeptidase MepM/ murein hydrolase activator NlpD
LVTGVAVVLASALSFTLFLPAGHADKLTDRRAEVKRQIKVTKAELKHSSKTLNVAAAAVTRTQVNLEAAQAQLAHTRRELAMAKARDSKMAAKLNRTRAELGAAKSAVVAGQKNLDAQISLAGQVVRDQYQQRTNLLPVALLVGSQSTQDLQSRLQWSTTMFDTAQAEIDELTVIQGQLEADKARIAVLEAQVTEERKAAAANLKLRQTLETRAAAEEASVAQLLREKQSAERAAAADVAEDKRRYAELEKEAASVEKRIAARVAKAKAAAARRAAAKQAAERAAAKARRAKQTAKSSKSSSKSSSKASGRSSSQSSEKSRSSGSSARSAGHGFSYPVPGAITSPFGRRFHPILRYWKLHDGTDFRGGCGTAIRAPYKGRVAERYYNGGYGNRLMIDHGYVRGRYVTTGYNHAIRYTVSVGERVRKGEVIGYVGSTGYSTGCHLHLMVWLDGRVVNPMRWF